MTVHDKVYELGEYVEVSPDDTGFKNSWYEAKIITIHKGRSKIKTPTHYDVEYNTLLEEDEATPLAERIKADRIRSLSPSPRGQHDFQLNDVVEAFYRDGWWVGVVSKVFEQSGNFEVTFRDPPDQIECKREDLRLHLQWNGGVWFLPQEANQAETGEKNSEKKKGRKRKALEANQPETGEKRPEKKKGRKCKALVWRNQLGMHIQKNLQKDSVGLSFGDVNLDPTNGEKDVHGYKEANNNSTTADSDSVPRKRDTEGSKETFHNKTVRIGENASAHPAPHNDDPGRSPFRITQDVTYSVKEPEGLVSETLDQAVATGITSVGNGRKFINHSRELEIVEQPEVIKDISNKFINPNWNKNDFLNPDEGTEIVEQTAGVEGHENEIVTKSSEIVDQAVAVERNQGEILDPMHETEILEQVAAVEENISILVNHNQKLNLVKEPSAVEGNVNKLAIKPNQELDKNGRNFVNTNQELETLDSNDQNLSFVKRPSLWNSIGSMQVFKAIPQRPHFRGLLDKKVPVHCLEAKAIGYMLMFHDIVQKTAESRLVDERELIVQRLVTLSKLEKNGFDVKGIRDRLLTLLKRKDEHTTIQAQLMEHTMKKTEIVGMIEELNEKIKEMQEKCAEAMSTKENIEAEIGHLETKAVDLNQSFDENIFEFERLRASP